MEISYYLHPKISGLGTQSVYMDIAYQKEPCAPPKARLQIATGVTVQTQKPNNWDPVKGEIKSTEKNYTIKRRGMSGLKDKAGDIIFDYNRQGKILEKKEFARLLKPPKGAAPSSAKDCRYYFNQWAHNNRMEVSGKHIKDSDTQLKHLEEFAPGIRPEDITERLVSDFKQYLIDKYNQYDSSMLKATNILKRILDEAGLKSNHKWLKRKKSGNSRGIVFDLHEQELVRQWDPETDGRIKDKQQLTALKRAKDLMLFLIATGPRYIDLKNLDKSDVKTFTLSDGKEIKVLEYYQIKGGQKRGRPCRVVLSAEALAIIDKYNKESKKLLPVPSNPNLNASMQLVCKLACMDARVKVIKYQGGKRIEITTHKNKDGTVEPLTKAHLAGCHRCRATLATNLFEGGADAKTIQDALGHDDPKTTQIYLHNKDTRQYKDMLQAMERLESKG